jgi:hypothetical protein
MPAFARRPSTSGWAFGDAGSQDSGTNSRQSTGHDAVSVTMLTETATWQFVTFPAVPVYCRATHGDAVPHLSSPVSSIAHAAGVTAASISCATRARTGTTSHGLFVTKWFNACSCTPARRAAIG